MGKLRLKRTPEEQAAHDLRKAAKRARKASKRHRADDDEDIPPKKRRTESPQAATSSYKYMFDEEDLPSSSYRAHKPDYDYIQAQVEEERFRDKLWGAFGDDERLDSVEASLNSYAHIPRRWRGGGMDTIDDELDIDPQMMEDEDYAEWMRAGMWRKKHAAEHAEEERKKAERAARHEQEKKLLEETKKMEKAEAERRRQRRNHMERTRWADARAHYEARWKAFMDPSQDVEYDLSFDDIPWPILVTEIGPVADTKGKGKARLELEDVTAEGIAAFLLPGGKPVESTSTDKDVVKKERRDKLRETMLRFHPDKFEGRIMRRVRDKDKEVVRDAVGRVTRAINDLLAEKEP